MVYEVCWYMRGLERWFIDTIENPDFCAALLDKLLQYRLDFENQYYFSRLFKRKTGIPPSLWQKERAIS